MRYLTSLLLMIAAVNVSLASDKSETGRTFTTADGNKITFTAPGQQTVYVTNKLTNRKEQKTFDKVPEQLYLLNGTEIASDPKNIPELEAATVKLQQTISNALKATIDKLEDGSYKYLVSNVLIDERGNVVYYTTEGLKDGGIKNFESYEAVYKNVSEKDRTIFQQELVKILSTLKSEPLIINGKPVPYATRVGSTFLK